jgi:hypothetical protein
MSAQETIERMAIACRESYMTTQSQRDANPWDALTETQRIWWRAPFVEGWHAFVDDAASWIRANADDYEDSADGSYGDVLAAAFQQDMQRE